MRAGVWLSLVAVVSARIIPLAASRRRQQDPREALLAARGGAGIFNSRRRSDEEESSLQRIVRTRSGFYPEVLQELEPQVSQPGRNSTFCVQQVQGTGDCLFHSIAISMAYDDNCTHVDMHDPWLDGRVRELRQLAVDTLTADPNCSLHLEGDQSITASELVAAAAEQYNMTSEDYCSSMRRKGVWGGGPEILALVNAMKRPIHVFEPVAACNGTEFRLQLCGAFGSPKFDKSGKRVCIIAADDRFPKCKPADVKRHGEGGNHFLSLIPTHGRELPPCE